MPSGAIVGFGGSVNVGGAIVGVRKWSATETCKDIDCTSMSSGGLREVKRGIISVSGSFETNEAASIAIGSVYAGTLSSGTIGGATAQTVTGSFLITNHGVDTPYDDKVTNKYDFVGGAVAV